MSGQRVDISNQTVDISGQTVNIASMPILDISGLATEETLLETYTLLNDNFSTGGLNVSLTALDGEKYTNTVVESKRGLDVNIINTSLNVDISGQRVDISNQTVDISGQVVNVVNDLNVNIKNTNSTVYDLTNDASTITGSDNRFESDRSRPNSWSFTNTKNQAGSNAFFYSNSTVSPLGGQAFDILYQDLQCLYCVVSINKSDDVNDYPFLAAYSPSESSFFTSRWVFTIDGAAKVLSTEKVLLYYGSNPTNIFTNIRHLPLVLNNSASLGPRLSTETVYLISCNTSSGRPTSSIYYNLYNCGFVLTDSIHNDYEFNSGIKSKGDLLLSQLNQNSGNLGVDVINQVSVNNDALTSMTFTTVTSDASIVGLNVITRNAFYPTTVIFTENDISITDETPSIDLRAYNKLSVFGLETHTGGGSHNIIVQYSNDDITFYDSPNVITSTGGKFSWDNSTFCVSYMRFRFQVELTSLTFIVSLK